MQNLSNVQNLSTVGEKSSLSPSQVERLQNFIKSLTGLVAYYPLNEESGDAINQAPETFGEFDGTVTGPVQGSPGLIGNAYGFDGADDIVSLGTSDDIEIDDGDLSFIALFNPSSRGENNQGTFFSRVETGYCILEFSSSVSNAAIAIRSFVNDDQFRVGAENSITLEEWQLVVCTFTGANQSGVHIYINGVEIEYSSGGSGAGNFSSLSGGVTTIGNNEATSRTFDGSLQHVAFLNRVLTAAEVEKLARVAGLLTPPSV